VFSFVQRASKRVLFSAMVSCFSDCFFFQFPYCIHHHGRGKDRESGRYSLALLTQASEEHEHSAARSKPNIGHRCILGTLFAVKGKRRDYVSHPSAWGIFSFFNIITHHLTTRRHNDLTISKDISLPLHLRHKHTDTNDSHEHMSMMNGTIRIA
jgi:hypothetical protein